MGGIPLSHGKSPPQQTKIGNAAMNHTVAVAVTFIAAVFAYSLSSHDAYAWQPPARKDCYDGFSTSNGCPWNGYLAAKELRQLSCQNLGHMRNRIYDQNGYCFQKPELKAQYNTDGCRWPIQVFVPLNKYERENIERIKKAESKQRCG
jgi:hypothetical protein